MDDNEFAEKLAMLEKCEAARLELIGSLTELETETIDSLVNALNKPQFWLSNRFKETEDFKKLSMEIIEAKGNGLYAAIQARESFTLNSPFYKEEHKRYQYFVSFLQDWDLI